jgi:protein SCO1/2
VRYSLQSKASTDHQLACLLNQRTFALLFSIIIFKFLLFFSHLGAASEAPVTSYINQPVQPHKTLLQAAQDIPLNSYSGPFKLADLKGKLVVLYFGYTGCPDVCPTALAAIGNSLKKLPASMRLQIQPVFISLDPKRDNIEKLNQYGRYFYPTMISASAKKPLLDQLAKEYWAFYKINYQTNSAMQYTVDHTSRAYILNRDSLLEKVLEHQEIPTKLETQLRLLLK